MTKLRAIPGTLNATIFYLTSLLYTKSFFSLEDSTYLTLPSYISYVYGLQWRHSRSTPSFASFKSRHPPVLPYFSACFRRRVR